MPIGIGVLPPFSAGLITDGLWVRAFARAIEEAGAESVWAVEHVLVAEDYEPRYPYSESGRMPGAAGTVMPDPIELLTWIGASTERIRLGTAVLVLPLHSPVVVAKRVATLDALSGGRVTLGVGSGWQIEEYAACGVPYDQRGSRLDDGIAALRELWRAGPRTHEGPYYAFADCVSEPDPVQPGGPPVVIGGSTPVAARRAGRLGDGFFPYVISPEDYAKRVATIRSTAAEAGRDPEAIELTVWPGSFAPGRSFDLDLVKRYAEAGVDRLVIAAGEASGGPADLDAVRRLIGEYREQVVERL